MAIEKSVLVASLLPRFAVLHRKKWKKSREKWKKSPRKCGEGLVKMAKGLAKIEKRGNENGYGNPENG